MVSFTGDKAMMYRANFCLRTAIRILKPIKHFTAKTADEVYEAVKSISWEDYLDNMSSFAVDAVVFSNEFRHSKFVAYKVNVHLYVLAIRIWLLTSMLQKTVVHFHSTVRVNHFIAVATVRNK